MWNSYYLPTYSLKNLNSFLLKKKRRMAVCFFLKDRRPHRTATSTTRTTIFGYVTFSEAPPAKLKLSPHFSLFFINSILLLLLIESTKSAALVVLNWPCAFVFTLLWLSASVDSITLPARNVLAISLRCSARR
jgi:hypothetical protein